LLADKMPSGTMYRPMIKQADAESIKPDKQGAFELLIEYLSNPEAEAKFKAHAIAYGWSMIDKTSMGNQVLYDEWKAGWQSILTAVNSEKDIDAFGQTLARKWRPRQELGNIDIYSAIPFMEAALGPNATVNVGIIIDDDQDTRTDKYPEDLNGFWHFINVMQFNPNFYFLSKVGMKNAIYTVLGSINTEEDEPSTGNATEIVIDTKWNDFMDDFVDDLARTCATVMMKNGIPAPTCVGYPLEGSKGEVIGECEIAWEDKKIAWFLPEQECDMDAFKDAGWTVIRNEEEVNISIFGGAVNE